MDFDIDLGKVAVTLGGDWNSSYEYERLTIVQHGGQSWLSREDNSGIEPGTNARVWQLVAAKGKDGKDGSGGSGGSGGGSDTPGSGDVIGVAYDESDGKLYWTKNGEWLLDPDGNKIAVKGVSPNTSFKSIVFKRSNTSVDAPEGGSYASPVPSGWSDGVPSGEAKLWMSTRIFSSDGKSPQQAAWTTPQVVADNEYMDYEFSSAETPGTPSKSSPTSAEENPNWSNTATTTTIFMAVREIKNGEYAPGSSWRVIRVKGEKGANGTSVTILGHFDSSDELPLSDNTAGDGYLIDGELWVWDGDSWYNAGQIKGDDGADGKNPYLHIKYSDDGGQTFTANGGETPGDYIGIYWDYSDEDSADVTDYAWQKWKGEDGFGYEYIFKLTASSTAPDVPSASQQVDDYVPSGWTDNPGDVSKDYPFCWVVYRKKTEGVWGAWIGSGVNPNKAALYSHYGKDGKDGVTPNASFKSIVFKRSNSSIDTPSGGTYESPLPNPLNGWSDGVPSGEGKLWMSTRIFSTDGEDPQQNAWTTPRVVADNEYFDYEFSSVEDNPGTPAKSSPTSAETNPNWSDTAELSTVYLAFRVIKNGEYAPGSSWQIIRVKGERGADGTSVNTKGSVASTDLLPGSGNTVGDGYFVDGDLYVWDGDSWTYAGHLQGEAGADGKTPILHIKYSDDGGQHFTANNGETPGDYIGLYWDYTVADSSNVSAYTWQKWKGEDGFGYEYIFKATASSTAPNVPSTSQQTDDYVPSGWTDDPEVSEDYPYCWVVYRKKTDGVWGPWKGSSTNTGKAGLFSHYGKNGSSGRGISGVQERYAVSPNDLDAPGAGWSATPPSMTETNKYLWNYEIITYTDGDTVTTRPVVIGMFGSGRGISSITEYYLASASSSGVTRQTSGWSTDPQTKIPDKFRPFLWNYEKVTYSDGTTYNSDPALIGHFGADGADGTPGVGISGVSERYAINNDPTTAPANPSTWSSSFIAPTENSPYLWQYEVITYSDGSTSTTSPHIVGHYGTDGAPGRGISNVKDYYLATSLTNVTRSTSGWTEQPQTISADKPYLWNYEEIIYDDGSPSTYTTPAIIGVYGLVNQPDIYYLDQVFGKDNVSGEDGALLRNFLGVMTPGNNAKVVTMMNASNIGQDPTHGRLFIAAGMNGIATSAGIAAAKFKVYEDGYFEAGSGKIGPYLINNDSLSRTLSRNGNPVAGSELETTGARWFSYDAHGLFQTEIGSYIGLKISRADEEVVRISDTYAIFGTENSNVGAQFYGPVNIKGSLTLAPGTHILGLLCMPWVETQSNQVEIDRDYKTYINRTVTVTAYILPNTPEIGEEYEFFTAGGTLVAQGSSRIFSFIGGSITASPGDTTVSLTSGYRYKVIYDGSNWLLSRS